MNAKKPSMISRFRKMRQPLPEPSAPHVPVARENPATPPSRQGLVNMSVWVDPALRTRLRTVALQQGTTLNELVNRYIHAGLVNDGETPR